MAKRFSKWPWQAMQRQPAAPNHVAVRDTDTADLNESVDPDATPAPSRWLNGSHTDLSPYGFSEEDGGLRQVESGAWKRAFSAPSKTATRKRFVPNTQAPQHPSVRNARPTSTYKQTLFWQSFCAGVLVVAGVFVTHHEGDLPQTMRAKVATVLSTDYTAQVTPTVDKVFSDMNVSVPAFGGATTVKLHAPIQGSIVDDFSANHPEIWLSGAAGAPVMAAGSGTVLNVVKTGSTELVRIDNGAFGTSIYDGLNTVSVKQNEYVTSGEVIGKLPSSPSHPQLRFSLIQNGKYVNPHDYIRFKGSGQ